MIEVVNIKMVEGVFHRYRRARQRRWASLAEKEEDYRVETRINFSRKYFY